MPSAARGLGAAFCASGRQTRVRPKSRGLRITVAAAAFGVLGVAVGANTGTEPAAQQQPTARHAQVQTAAFETELPTRPHSAPNPEGPVAASPVPVQVAPTNPAPAPAAPAPADPAPAPASKPKDQVDQWIDEATGILLAHGVRPDQIDHDAIRTIVMHESNGDPGASNDWDSNASAGTPSIGLMQTIEPTFESFALPGFDDIHNPVHNIVAGSRYAIERYGSLADVPGVAGLRSGGSYQGY